ncbi:MAG: hypothetical protein O3A37_14515, partial [Planctomycetota bacterium]|nr:hypothetical protein [Planctomycetota bacterium]
AVRSKMANPTGAAGEQGVSPIDLEHIEGLEARWVKGIALLDQPFEAVRVTKPDPLSPWGPWQFRTDPDDRGVQENWFARDVAAESWREIPVPAPWSDTWNSGYVGSGWYRTTFRFPREWAGEPLRLSFGGVADKAWVFVNGVAVGEYGTESEAKDVEQLRDRPFEIMVPATVIRPGEVNTLVVRVHSSCPDGGIRERVDGAAPHPEDRRRLPPWDAP